jgi:hypothetical protein
MRREALILILALTLACAPRPEAKTPRVKTALPASGKDFCGMLLAGGPQLPVILPPDRPVRVLAFGDFGDGGAEQKKVARAMAEHDRAQPFDFGITLGDNFYQAGINDPASPRWARDWELLYDPLGIRVYATLGNHDYLDPVSPEAEIERSRRSESWCLPRRYYTFAAGPVQFFALDTDPIERGEATVAAQLDWLRRALQSSPAPWKIVYGHHPVYTNGEHGKDLGYLPRLREKLLPILAESKVDVYLAGHDHDLEALNPEGGVTFFVSGGGGKEKRPLRTSRCRAWAESAYGFTVLEATEKELTVRFFGDGGQPLYETTLRKGETGQDCPRP